MIRRWYNLNLKFLNNETSSKAWWKLNKNELGISKRVSIPSLVSNIKIISYDVEKCEALNVYFADQCKSNVTGHAKQNLDIETNNLNNNNSPPTNLLNEIKTTAEEI